MKTFVQWAALMLLVVVVLILARDPAYSLRYLQSMIHGRASLSLYQPRELVPGANQPPPPRVTPAAELLEARALIDAADYAAAHRSRAFIVSRHGYIVFERYWQGTSFDTVIESRGLGPVVAALATGSAISQRLIGWPDEPIGYFIPAWRNDPRGAITVRNLLQRSSGLTPPVGGHGPWSARSHAALSSDILAQYLQRPLEAAPGDRWLEQSADPDLLGVVLERATHQRFAVYVSSAVWQRIGAADAWVWLDRPGGAAHVERGFLSRQGDWLRVAELLLSNGRYQGAEVIVPRWVPQLLQPSKSRSDQGAYVRLGAHSAAGGTPYAASDLVVIEGGTNRLWLVPSLQLAILRTGDLHHEAPDWDDARIPNLVVRGARDFVPSAARPGGDLSTIVPSH